MAISFLGSRSLISGVGNVTYAYLYADGTTSTHWLERKLLYKDPTKKIAALLKITPKSRVVDKNAIATAT